MKRKYLFVVASLIIALAGGGLVACGGEGETPFAQEPKVADVTLEWNGYSMGIDQITDDTEQFSVSNADDYKGRPLKVCFAFISHTDGRSGFTESLLSDLESMPIVLRDSEGVLYEWTKTVSNMVVEGTVGTDSFGMAEVQPRFSIFFDIPEEVQLEDLVLDTGDGQRLKLVSYTSDAYAAEQSSEQ